MKTTLTLFFLAICGLANAQITVTQADMAVAGDMAIIANDTACTVPPGGYGPSQTWNLGAIQNHYQDTIWYLNPAGQPGAANFPTATIVQKMSGMGTYSYMYMKVTAAYYDMLGVYDVTGGPVTFTPAFRQMTFPSTYNTTFSGTSGFEVVYAFPIPPYDSAKFKLSINYSSLMDAWGSVTTPSGTKNSLRQKITTTQLDSTFMHNTLTNMWEWDMNPPTNTATDSSYGWIANLQKYMLAGLNFTGGGGVSPTGSYLIYTATGVEDLLSNNQFKLYPNPFSSETALESAQDLHDASLILFNTLGQQLRHIDHLTGSKVSFQRQDLPAGVYYLQLTEDHKVLATRKLVITE